MYPEAFTTRMRRLLGDDAEAFFAEFERDDSVRSLRVNTRKWSVEAFLRATGEELSPVPYTPDGFYCGDTWGGRHLHRAGGYYLQDPAAMSPVCAPDVQPGWRVLDLCASPGGKTAQLASFVGDSGFVVSGELNPTRCRTLGGNVERMGFRNVMVMNGDGVYIASLFPGLFDLVLADVPCSGEGMFRKNPEAVEAWSEETVHSLAARQKSILEAAAEAVRPGGFLLYSTCTFSTEENEEQIDAFLSAHPEFSLHPVSEKLLPYTAPGIAFPGCRAENIHLARRFYPHLCPGEGQFLALMQRSEAGVDGTFAYADASRPLTAEESRVADTFFKDTLAKMPTWHLRMLEDRLIALPCSIPVPPHCVFSAGVTIGQFQKGRLVPHHQFFMAYGEFFKRQIRLSEADARLGAYLHGESIPAPGLDDGWTAIFLEECTLGGGKTVGETTKNHYPKGLRI